MIIVILALPAAFLLSLAVAIHGWRLVEAPAFGRDSQLAIGGALIGTGLICIGMPLIESGWSPLWLFFLLPFTACVGALVRGVIVVSTRPYSWPTWRNGLTRWSWITGSALALVSIGSALGAGRLDKGDSIGFRLAFSLGCLMIGFGLGHLPRALNTQRRCTMGLHLAMLAAPYFALPLLAVVLLLAWRGENPFSRKHLEFAFHPLVRGCLVGTAASTALAIALWARRVELEDRESSDHRFGG